MELVAAVLAQDTGLPGIPDGVESLSVIAALVTILSLWLRGTLKRSKDCDEQATAAAAAAKAQLDAVQTRLDAVVADRDAWREAQREEAEARRAAERMARDMMESTNISLALLSALKDMAAGKLDR